MQELLIILRERAELKLNSGSQVEITTLSLFDEKASKVEGFVMICKLYLRMRIKGTIVKEQVQWMLMYVQGRSANV